MSYAQRLVCLAMAGIVAIGMTASGCATPWFETKPKPNTDTQPAGPPDMKSAAARYINSLCKMSRELRDTKVRELNEAVLPNHATISCGPGSGDGP
jgi:PBP1b-binding outer membrane lipoprotein LpoB